MKVSFIIVGAQKSGSTALARFLGKHPQIGFAAQKECHFFNNDDYFVDENVNYSIYHKYWSHILLNPNKFNQCKIYGESTPCYMYWQESIERIKKYNPQMKLIFILRNPIDRAYSHWNMIKDRSLFQILNNEEKVPFFVSRNFKIKNYEFLSFSEALSCEEMRMLKSKDANKTYSYINRGFYFQQITKIINLFPRQQMLFLKTEELKNNFHKTLNSIFNFLEVDNCNSIKPEIINSRQYPPMEESDRQFLKKKFAQEIIDLENLLNWDLSEWKK